MRVLPPSGPKVSLGALDAHPVLAPMAAAGLLVGAALALFGLPPLHLHGPLHHAGIMDPLCGLTRGLRFAMQGEVSKAWSFNPASLLLVAGAVAVLVRSGVGALTGRWVNVDIRSAWKPVAVVVAAGLLALWLNQQLHAELLTARP